MRFLTLRKGAFFFGHTKCGKINDDVRSKMKGALSTYDILDGMLSNIKVRVSGTLWPHWNHFSGLSVHYMCLVERFIKIPPCQCMSYIIN